MPPVYLTYRFAKYLLPMSKEEYDLEALKIRYEAEK
jgi:hypothetical protein